MMILNREPLEEWREQEGRQWKWVAAKLGCRPDTFYHKLAGRNKATLEDALTLEKLTGIPLRNLVVEKPEPEAASA